MSFCPMLHFENLCSQDGAAFYRVRQKSIVNQQCWSELINKERKRKKWLLKVPLMQRENKKVYTEEKSKGAWASICQVCIQDSTQAKISSDGSII